MSFETTPSNVHTIRESDPNFRIRDGMVIYPRATIDVSPECPNQSSRCDPNAPVSTGRADPWSPIRER